jgi:hypothetical protein
VLSWTALSILAHSLLLYLLQPNFYKSIPFVY